MQFWSDIMIDTKKRERFLSSFNAVEKDILVGYVNALSATNSDIYLVMARKATCLIEALVELGSLSLNGKVYSERILDLDQGFLHDLFKDKTVTVIDDTIVSGTTISDVVKSVLDYGAKHVAIEVITVNGKWYTPELLHARLKGNEKYKGRVSYSNPVELVDNDSIKFCFDIVKGLSIIPKLYDYDFPRIKLQKWKGCVLSPLFINDMGWKYFDCSTPFQNENGVFTYTCIPSEHVVKEFDKKCGINLSDVANCKIRFLGYRSAGGSFNLTAVPMIIFNSIYKDDLNKYIDILFCDDKDKINSLFVSDVSKLRLLQYVLSISLMELWMKHAKSKNDNENPFFIRNFVDKQVEIMLFSEMGHGIISKFQMVSKPFELKAKSIVKSTNDASVLDDILDDHIIKAKVVEPFINFYDNKELPCRTAVKSYDYDNFSEEDFQAYMTEHGVEYGRLKHGVTFTELCEKINYLEGGYDYVTYASVLLDKLISRGIAVPIIQEDEECLYRAYRHGEDAIMGDMEHRIVAWTLNKICEKSSVDKLTKIPTEKLIALLIKFGVRRGWIDSLLNDNQTIDNYKVIVSNRHDLHGMRPQVSKYQVTEFHSDPWYTYYLQKKGYLKKEDDGGYSFYPPKNFDASEFSKGSNDINNFSIVFAKLIDKVQKKEISRDDFNWHLTKLASCVHPRDLLDALIAEVEIFNSWWKQNEKDFNYNTIRDTAEYAKAKTAVNSGQVKFYAYKNNEVKSIIETFSSLLDDDLYSNVFTSFFDLQETQSKRDYHDETIDVLGCWLVTVNLAVRILELAYYLGDKSILVYVNNEMHTSVLDYFNGLFKGDGEEIACYHKNSFYDKMSSSFDTRGITDFLKILSDVMLYVYKVSFFMEGFYIPKQIVNLMERIIKGELTGTDVLLNMNAILRTLNYKISNQLKKAHWQVDNYSKTTDRKLYKNCVYIKFHRHESRIIDIIESFLLSDCLHNGDFPYVVKTQDSIFDEENDICIAYYDNDRGEIRNRVIALLRKLKPYYDDIEKMFSFQKLPPQYSIEVIKNSVDAMPFVHSHNLLELINKLAEENAIGENWIFEICYDGALKLRFNQLFSDLHISNEKGVKGMLYSQYNKGKISNEKVEIGIITVLNEEYNAMYSLLQEPTELCVSTNGAGHTYVIGKLPAANNNYHTVALAQCAGMGNNLSSIKATQMKADFKNIKYIFITGIAAGVPNINNPEKHVRLGDVVVADRGGVIQYDMIKLQESRVQHRNINIPPSSRLLEACKKVERDYKNVLKKDVLNVRPSSHTDILYDENKNAIEHPNQNFRIADKPCFFIGKIGSANILLKDAKQRDALVKQFGLQAFEMEGSGIADATWIDEIGYMIVRGISDYADAFKNDLWHEYAAAAAASATAEILENLYK